MLDAATAFFQLSLSNL